MFSLSKTPLEQKNLREGMTSLQVGALCCFEGLVRDHNDGKKVQSLEYEAAEILCQKEAGKIFEEVKEKFDCISMRCFHRIGRLNVGEMAVWVGVMASHRDESFKACRYIIDELKKRLPIWKKEYYADGDSGWIGCPSSLSHSLSDSHEK